MTKLQEIEMTGRLTSQVWAGVLMLAVTCGLATTAASVAAAQEPFIEDQEQRPLEGPAADVYIRKELQKLKNLEITQRKARAEALIREYPDTEAAKLVRRYLQELNLYEQAAEEERAVAEAHKARVREYWRQVIAAELQSVPNYRTLPLVRITNQSDQAVLYQIHGYGMHWTRPRFLDPGATDEVNYPVNYRRITEQGTVMYSLQPGVDYVFRQSAPGEIPQLYRATADAQHP